MLHRRLHMNIERKLIFFDIDGTIVTEARDGRIIPV